ncbi:unnamed protein product [Thelazia callipaeda]|uniref:PX domain-containing protein n=1 Tax=Thelazia callipaeda TaxID=103827 RepID=A0A158RC38_THECL|nr:unnamed protein product [Thelazia callipaeda]
MVGRKKRSSSTRNHFGEIVHHGAGDFAQNSTYRDFSSVNNGCRNGNIVESGCSPITTTFNRKLKQYNNHSNHKNQKNMINTSAVVNMNENFVARGMSRETGSASGGSVISCDVDEDESLSASGQEVDSAGFRFVKKCSVALMTEKESTCSVGTQTTEDMDSDLLLSLCSAKCWQRIHIIAEAIQCLNAYEQRYIATCVEALLRAKSLYMRHCELKYNSVDFLQNSIATASCSQLQELAFPVLCLLHSTNRSAAAAYMGLIERLFEELICASVQKQPFEKQELMDLVRFFEKFINQKLRLTVSAAQHHAAFSVDHKISLAKIQTDLDNLLPTTNENQRNWEASTSESDSDVPIVISRLEAHISNEDSSPNIFSIAIEWSDLKTSYIVRTADQIADLHNRLLDSFPSEAGALTGNPRVLPYLNRSQPGSILGYIRALPDLPARVLVCPIVRDFFYPSRLESSSLSSIPQSLLSQSLSSFNDLKKPTAYRQTKSSSNLSVPEVSVCYHPSLPVTTGSVGVMNCTSVVCPPFSLASVPPPPRSHLVSLAATRQYSLMSTTTSVPTYPSFISLPPNPNGFFCCNCSGPHQFAYCTQPTMLQIIASGEYRIDYSNVTTNSSILPLDVTNNILVTSSLSPTRIKFSTPPPVPNSR